MSRLLEVLSVEQLGPDRYRGAASATKLNRTFGGQVAAQALVAAVQTVPADRFVHSLHGYFLRPGDPAEAVDFDVDRVRDGHSFVTRRVTGVQHGKAIFTMAASFQAVQDGPDHQDTAPDLPHPDDAVDSPEDEHFHGIMRSEWPEWDVKRVPNEPGSLVQRVWLRHRDPLPDDAVLHACALAYASDLTLLSATRLNHKDEDLQMASLDHAIWFQRPFRADAWMLYDQSSPSAGAGRGLAQGRIYDLAGNLLAVVVQEGLMRYLDSSATSTSRATSRAGHAGRPSQR